ncbi:restriction system protein [Paenibacillus sp. V4I3]|uniref:restriction endonuclease n=1 Tax=Paenibacillus sp. V4I3 TaxID=3042305 RepID=UPI00277D2D9E|nr:restriction endonuclease [Paenibacillus sp. V4I3]MDQ0875000.1 restriction system protein [Paenibacillus sp. V4I3]
MARRRRKKQTFEDMIIEILFKSLIGCVFFVVFNIGFMGKYAQPIGGSFLNVVLIILIVVLAISLGIYLASIKAKLQRANINEIDNMSGTMFERYLEQFFKRQGWEVKRTGGQGDYGADLILKSATKKVIVQAKRWKQNVGYEAIQQAYSAKDVYKATEAWVITNSRFTEQARDGAKRLGIKLWDRDVLIEQMAGVNASQTIKVSEQEQQIVTTIREVAATSYDENNNVCASCSKPVTQKVKDYCLANPKRFNNQILCYEHQRS